MKDRYGRQHNSLRISVTDRCNLRCRYCMPAEGLPWMEKKEILTFEELTRLTRIFAQLGVTKLRLSGGEPLLRRNLPRLLKKLAAIPGIQDLAMTTNGFFLDEQAKGLIAAGLMRFNVSLDSMDPVRFSQLTRRDYYQRVWGGLEKLQRISARPIKINVVLLRGWNDDEIPRFAHLARTRPFIIRFIEYMPLGAGSRWSHHQLVPTDEVIERINQLGPTLIPLATTSAEPAKRYTFADGCGELGFISSVTHPFCESCNRLRLTADGKLRNCLFSNEEADLKQLLRDGRSDGDIEEAILQCVVNKAAGHLINHDDFIKPERTMSQIGG